jgi:8-oxo-dGTP pyrophosphatase MutT (NUDIX family)
MPPIKKSFGIICFRPSTSGHQILMVKKSVTYHFCEFAAGHYYKHNPNHMQLLFNNMTYHEKMTILSLRFQNIWYQIYRENPDKVFLQGCHSVWAASYFKKKKKFEMTFLLDNGDKLRELIANSSNVDTTWEFPKGRRDETKSESEISAAIREFYEETGIRDDKFSIMWHLTPYIETYTDFGTTYQNIYYFASAIGIWEPEFKFYDKQQMSEIAAVKWISKSNLHTMKLDPSTYKRLINSFTKIIKKYKSHSGIYIDISASY